MTESTPQQPTVYKLGAIEGTQPSQRTQRISLLLWGQPGNGKTTLAASAPGKKLIIQFDSDGDASLTHRDDCIVVDYSQQSELVLRSIIQPDPLGIDAFLLKHAEVESVVVDSLTKLNDLVLDLAVRDVKEATLTNPGIRGYGYRTAYIGKFLANLLRITGKLNRHLVLVGHEKESMTDDGDLRDIQVLLGGSLNKSVISQISESWALTDTGKERRLAVRPCRMRVGLKSRMFDTSGSPEFVWSPDLKDTALTVWYNNWKNGGFQKMPLPKSVSK